MARIERKARYVWCKKCGARNVIYGKKAGNRCGNCGASLQKSSSTEPLLREEE